MADLPRGLRHDPVRYDAWLWLSQVHQARGDEPEHRKAMAKAWPLAAVDQQLKFGTNLAFTFWDATEDLTRAERRLAQRAASAGVQAAEEALTKFTDETDGQARGGADPGSGDTPSEGPALEGPALEGQFEARRRLARAFAALACTEQLLGHDAALKTAMERTIELDPANLEFRALARQLLGD